MRSRKDEWNGSTGRGLAKGASKRYRKKETDEWREKCKMVNEYIYEYIYIYVYTASLMRDARGKTRSFCCLIALVTSVTNTWRSVPCIERIFRAYKVSHLCGVTFIF